MSGGATLTKIENAPTRADETPQVAITLRNCGTVVLVEGILLQH